MTGNSCPVSDRLTDSIELAHGGGGLMTARLIESVFAPAFSNPILDRVHDGAVMPPFGEGERIAMSTDSFVVQPIFFPGGNIGDLAVNGTVNDLLCCGARPRWMSVSFIIEEGMKVENLRRVVASMAESARLAEIEIVTGDTKVVEKGRCDGVYINTSGIGVVAPGVDLDPRNIRPGDVLIVSGPVASHGMAVMSCREGLGFESSIISDSASLCDMAANLLDVCGTQDLRVLRDPTRGGLASTLNELAAASGVDITIDEQAVPVLEPVARACDMLGLDPMHVACEGVIVAVVSADVADVALAAMRRSEHCGQASVIGRAEIHGDGDAPNVWVRMPLGTRRRLEMLSGEQLPRIC